MRSDKKKRSNKLSLCKQSQIFRVIPNSSRLRAQGGVEAPPRVGNLTITGVVKAGRGSVKGLPADYLSEQPINWGSGWGRPVASGKKWWVCIRKSLAGTIFLKNIQITFIPHTLILGESSSESTFLIKFSYFYSNSRKRLSYLWLNPCIALYVLLKLAGQKPCQ